MLTLILLIVAVVGLLAIMRREAGALPALVLLAVTGLASLLLASSLLGVVLLLAAALVAVTGLPALRVRWLTPRLFTLFKKVAPRVSETERVARPS